MTSSPSEVGRITLERVTFRYLEQSKLSLIHISEPTRH